MNKKLISKVSIEKLIQQEIEWCKENKEQVSKDYYKGFIKGLKQSILIIKEYEKRRTAK